RNRLVQVEATGEAGRRDKIEKREVENRLGQDDPVDLKMSYGWEIILLFVTYVVYTQIKDWMRWRKARAFGAKNGCADAPVVPNVLPGGVERFAGVLTGLKAILATKFNDFAFGPIRKDNLLSFLGNGIFTSEGEAWSHYRAKLRPQFARSQVSDLESAQEHLDILWKALPDEDAEGWVGGSEGVDLVPYLFRFTMDVSTEFLFGSSVGSQSHVILSNKSGDGAKIEVKEDLAFVEAMSYTQEFIAWRIRLQTLWWMANTKKFRDAEKTCKAYADKFVKLALEKEIKRDGAAEKKPATTPSGHEKFVLLDSMVEDTQDPIELRDQILQILLAGRDTTSALLSWTFLLLARHPEIFDGLREEVLSALGSSSSTLPTFESLKACKPLQNVLFEALRLYPVVPLNGRVAIRDTVLPEGGGPDHTQPIVVRAGEGVGYSAYVMQRRSELWGEDSDEFRPERWEGRKLGWDFIGFSGGPRICIGRKFFALFISFPLL
ncbi:hypothetical protein DH86_00004288, partial [Scytalidium sp. 3C]